MSQKKRESKRIPKHAQAEIDEYVQKAEAMRSVINDIITIKKLEFELTTKQKTLMKMIDDNKIITVTGPPGTAKAQPLTAKILTSNGWKLMGDIQINDEVISVNGQPTKVLGVFPQGEKEIYKISFSDGSSTECTGDHLWLTWKHSERIYYKKENGKKIRTEHPGTVRNTEELIGNLIGKDGRLNYSIPIVKPIQFKEKKYNIDPYLLGALLGDGHLGTYIGFSTNDDEIFNKLNNILLPLDYKLSIRYESDTNQFKECAITSINPEKWKINKIRKYITDLKLMNTLSDTKFIPQEYLFGSIEQRLELLRGLLDTDGSVSRGCIKYSTSSKQLRDDVTSLIQSLGGVVTYTTNQPNYIYKDEKKICKDNYRLNINLPEEIAMNCFSLTRKQELVKTRVKYFPTRYITNIIPVRIDEAQCIMVEDKKHLYITDDYIVTHNTFMACYNAVQALLRGDFDKIIISKPTDILSGTKELGHLPGGLEEKLQVYIESFLDCFMDILRPSHFQQLWDNKIIEFKPAQFLRGRTLKNSVIIIDEFQNFDIKTLKSIVTRLGKNSKMIFMGDTKQNDINKRYVAVDVFKNILSEVKGCASFEFVRQDIVREQILIDIIDKFEEYERLDLLPDTIKNT